MSNIETVNNIKINLGGTQGPMGITRAEFDALNKGGPAGVYDNLAALQSSEDADKTRIYLTTDNGNWNYWDGSSWVSGGVYQALYVDDYSVVYESKIAHRVAFPLVGGQGYINIDTNRKVVEIIDGDVVVFVNKKFFTLKQGIIKTYNENMLNYIWVTKEEEDFTIKLTTDKSDDAKNEDVFLGIIGISQIKVVQPYKINGNISISGMNRDTINYSFLRNMPVIGSTLNIININTTDENIEIKEGYLSLPTKIIKVLESKIDYSEANSNFSLIATDDGNVLIKTYPYAIPNDNEYFIGAYSKINNYWIGSDNVSIDNRLSSVYSLFNKAITINCLGDSITAGYNNNNISWVNMLKNYINIKEINNYGISGSVVSDYVDYYPMCNRYMEMKDGIEYVIIFGGNNDYTRSVPIGEEDDSTTKTFYGALNTLLKGLRDKYPTARFLYITPLKMWDYTHIDWSEKFYYYDTNKVGKTLKDYRDAIINRCEYYCIPYLDIYTFSLYGGSSITKNSVYTDGLHPNNTGHDILAKKIASKILDI